MAGKPPGGKSSHEKRGVLIAMADTSGKEMVKLRRDATILGRDKADIVIQDAEVSATHCQIQNISDAYHIFDMNSSNGTFVNGVRIVKAKLQEGDVVRIGQTQFRFALEDERNVRHIPTLFKSRKSTTNSIVDTLIEKELKEPQAVLVLQITYPNGSGETVELPQKTVIIGRASSFGKFDRDSQISRKHLMIKLNDTGEVFIEDQGSTNGSMLNGKTITGMHLVHPKDEIRVGGCRIQVSVKRV